MWFTDSFLKYVYLELKYIYLLENTGKINIPLLFFRFSSAILFLSTLKKVKLLFAVEIHNEKQLFVEVTNSAHYVLKTNNPTMNYIATTVYYNMRSRAMQIQFLCLFSAENRSFAPEILSYVQQYVLLNQKNSIADAEELF
jgi:hypothetical protein